MSIPTAPSLSERYQEATKYTPQSVQQPTALDFSTQPSAFKDWHQARRMVLEGGPGSLATPSPGRLDAVRLGRLLHHTYGVTLVREFPGMTMHYRAAPSAGGLYPTDLYVAVREIEGIPDGIHAYDARDHSLVLCWEGNFWPDLAATALGHPAIDRARAVLLGTGVWERSTWRYGDRGYRRVLLDTGHVFGNAVLASVPDGLCVVPIPYFIDEGISNLLLIDDEREGALLLGAVLQAEDAASLEAVAPMRSTAPSPEGEPGEGGWPVRMHRASRLEPDAPAAAALEDDEAKRPRPVGSAIELPADRLADGPTVLAAIRRRRSTRVFAPGPMPLDAVGRILAHAYPPTGSPDPRAALAPEVLRSWLVVAGVNGMQSGVYRYDAGAHTAVPIQRGNPRDDLHRSCLWQNLGGDCAFAVVHTMDLPSAVASHGERIYRTAHLDAGLIGQRLNMAALRMGYGASGIGGFFDEFLNALLLLGPRHAIVYVTAIGIQPPGGST